MTYSGFNSEDRLVQDAFAEHLEKALAQEAYRHLWQQSAGNSGGRLNP